MKEISETFNLTICEASPNVTSSLASVAGATPLDSPTGQMKPPSGLDRALVSLSALQVSLREFSTRDTCGPLFDGLSPSASLQSALESKLRQKMAKRGLLAYALTWRHLAMPSGLPIYALRASVRTIYAKDFTLLPTPRASMGKHMIAWCRAEKGEHRSQLEDFLASWWLKHGGTRIRGLQPDPYLCLTMMGYPESWLDAATPLSRKSRKRSSKLQEK